MRIDSAPWGNLFWNGWATEDVVVSDADRMVLRELASRMAELSTRPGEGEKKKLWTDHNDLQATRPPVMVMGENGWNEILRFDRDIRCSGGMAQDWEMWLRKEIYRGSVICDDRPIEPVFYVPYRTVNEYWGLLVDGSPVGDAAGLEDRAMAYTWKSRLEDISDEEYADLDLSTVITEQPVVVDHEASRQAMDVATDVFGGVLDVRRRIWWAWSGHLTLAYSHLRGLQRMMLDFYDHPEKVHEAMSLLTRTYLDKLRQLEREGLLTSNVGNTTVGSGGLGYTRDLDDKQTDVRLADMWGLAEAQETSEISPRMYKQFVFPYLEEIAEVWGLNCVACCEPVQPHWQSLKTLPRLRRVSVSQWNEDFETVCEDLGSDYIFSYKANSAAVTVPNMDDDAVRAELRTMIERAIRHENRLEIILKDLHTLSNDPGHITRWMRIAREEIGRAY